LNTSGTSYAEARIVRRIGDALTAIAKYQRRPNRSTAARCRAAGRKLAALPDKALARVLNNEQVVVLYFLFCDRDSDENLQ
jgi:hypothetical protein